MMRLLLLLSLFCGSAFGQALPSSTPYSVTSSGNVTTFNTATVTPANAASFTFSNAANGPVYANSGAVVQLPANRTASVVLKSAPAGAAIGGALLNFAKKTFYPLQVGVAVYDLFQELGMTPVRDNTGVLTVTAPSTTVDCQSTIIANAANFIAGGQQMLCSGTWITSSGVVMLKTAPNSCAVFSTCPNGSTQWNYTWSGTTQQTTTVLTDQQVIDTIAAKSTWPAGSNIGPAITQAVQSEPLLLPQPVSVTGPASVAGPSTTSTQQFKDAAGNPTGTQTTTNTTNYNISYGPNTVTTTTTNTTTVTNPDGTSSVKTDSEQTAPDSSASDTPLGDVPKLYTRKYPNGLTGVWDTQKAALLNTSLLRLTSNLMPTITASGYPSFPVPVVIGPWNFGTYDVSPPPLVWDFLKLCVIITALFLARALIFGG